MRLTPQSLLLAILLVVIGVVLALQRQANVELRGTIALYRVQNQEVTQLRVEQIHLEKQQISAAELESLRADHAAIVRLRGEIDSAKARLVEMERAQSSAAPHN